ncbi:hypothetical protein H0E87_010854 [Populus deltoides]|uniref:Uncharacterized protein n=1 Tax=Populus deltoides TaxID=3696 RepID=A0A8T2YUS5_POPDE|nr:hypothetical protein H0E87_010854 [Populus deltoides]
MAATALQHQLNLQKATNNCAKTTVTETKVPGNTGGTLPVVGPTRRHEYDSERDGFGRQAHTIFNVGRGHAQFGPKRARKSVHYSTFARVLGTENFRLLTGVQTKDNAEIEITLSRSSPFMS